MSPSRILPWSLSFLPAVAAAQDLPRDEAPRIQIPDPPVVDPGPAPSQTPAPQTCAAPAENDRSERRGNKSSLAEDTGGAVAQTGGAMAGGAVAGPIGAAVGGVLVNHVGRAIKKVVGGGKKHSQPPQEVRDAC
jgi:hypothetical protein